MYKSITFLLFLGLSKLLFAQQVDFYYNSNYPAAPIGGILDAEYLISSQMLYPTYELTNKEDAIVFISVKVLWNGEIETISSNIDSASAFSKEALRLVSLLDWKTDLIRKDKKIEPQQIKITFDPRKYSRIHKKRDNAPRTIGNSIVHAKSQLDKRIELIHYKSLNEYTRENIRYPALALQRTISGMVKVRFIIEKNGKASNFDVVQTTAGGCNEETLRLLKAVRWEPGMIDNKPVRVRSEYSLSFVHPGNTYR